MNARDKAVAEIRRELRVRSTVYPRLIEAGKLSQLEADRRTEALTDAVTLLCDGRWADDDPARPITGQRID